MINLTTAFRLIRIQRVLLRYGLDEFVFAMHLFRPLRFFTFLSPSYWMGKRKGPRGERIRRALEDLGPIFVKFGQILSTRQDLLPPDIGEELSQLQDNVPPFAEDLAQRSCMLLQTNAGGNTFQGLGLSWPNGLGIPRVPIPEREMCDEWSKRKQSRAAG